MGTRPLVLSILMSSLASTISADSANMELYLPFRGLQGGYLNSGDDCPFTECCKEKAMSVVSQCYTMGPLLSALLSIALFVKLTYSSAATVCTTTTLEMSTTTGTVEKFITVTSVSTVVSTTLQVFPVTSVLLATAVLARTFEQLETAPLVYTTITVTSAVISTSTVATVQIDDANNRCRYRNGNGKRDLEEIDHGLSEPRISGQGGSFNGTRIAPSKKSSQAEQTKLYDVKEDSWFPYLEDSGHSTSLQATRTPIPSSSSTLLQPSFRF